MEIYGMTGERLGPIGSEGQEPEPEWKRILLSRPSVSVRRGIAWVCYVFGTLFSFWDFVFPLFGIRFVCFEMDWSWIWYQAFSASEKW